MQKMTGFSLHARLQYSPFNVFILGGLMGSLLNIFVSILLYDYLEWNPFSSFFMGTVVNELFHHLYYYLIFVNREIRMKTKLLHQISLYILVACGSIPLFWIFMVYFHLAFPVSVILSIICLSLLNVLTIQISHFASSEVAHVEYRDMDESFYNDQTDNTKVSRFRAWYHSSRYRKLSHFISEYYLPGMAVADLGCGNCLWNVNQTPVIGADINEDMLRWAVRNNRLQGYSVTDNLAATGLPCSQFDIVVMSETLEHISNISAVMEEVHRILKDNGSFLLTVPYDIFLGPFFILFNLNCVYLGFFRGSRYHRYRCGHINHFTKKRLYQTLKENGFNVERLFTINSLILYCHAKKNVLASSLVSMS
jgi:ubiquinone/menaquinone biosynthesis C-methylase UbiE